MQFKVNARCDDGVQANALQHLKIFPKHVLNGPDPPPPRRPTFHTEHYVKEFHVRTFLCKNFLITYPSFSYPGFLLVILNLFRICTVQGDY